MNHSYVLACHLCLLAAACGGRPYPGAAYESGAGTPAGVAEYDMRARRGLPLLTDASYQAAKAQFLIDEADYRADPVAFFERGSPIACPLDIEFEAKLIHIGDAASTATLALLEGACVGGRFDGPVVYKHDWSVSGISGTSLVSATFVDGQLDGPATQYDRSDIRKILKNTRGSKDVEFSYLRYSGHVAVETNQFGIRDDDPAWHAVMVGRVDDRGVWHARLYAGMTLDSEVSSIHVPGGIALHGPLAGMCFDYNRGVKRSSCSRDMPPTVGVPSDLMPGVKPQTKADVDAELLANQSANRERARQYLRKRGTTQTAAVAPATAQQPATKATTAPPVITPAASAPPASTQQPAAATAPAPGKVASLCAAAAGHQAGLFAPRDEKLRAQLATPLAASCKDTRWSTERIKCVLDATDTAQLQPCQSMPAAAIAVKAGDPVACKAAAANQAKLTAGGDASLQKSLASSIEKLCKSEKWPSTRLSCVRAATSADAASRCAS